MYDENPNDASQYCPHGTFIGSWWGLDYLCGWCEDGISVAEMHTILRQRAYNQAQTIVSQFDDLVTYLTDHRVPGQWTPLVRFLEIHAETEAQKISPALLQQVLATK
jgi:hypothetical protein